MSEGEISWSRNLLPGENGPLKEHRDFEKNVIYAEGFILNGQKRFPKGFEMKIKGILLWFSFRWENESKNFANPLCFHMERNEFQGHFRDNFNAVMNHAIKFWKEKEKRAA